ncbi:MAG: hypothetical protein AzoDbin1_05201, partial [Azoarcus sp.]|nr:hypothetical protein [Azoarcus sp.]
SSLGHLIKSAAPAIAGTLLGGPLGGALGMSGTAASVVGGALAGGGLGALTGQGALQGAIGGGLGGYAGAPGAGAAGNATALASGASDPIQAIYNAMQATGTDTATQAANALGFGSTEAMLAAANPAWVSGLGALGVGPTNALTNIAPGTMGVTPGGSAVSSGAVPGFGGAGMAPTQTGLMSKAAQIGPMSLGLNALSGLEQMRMAQQLQQSAQQADPMAAYRAQYAQQLQQLQQNPSSVANMPGYQAGLDAVQRSLAAQGYTGSGNMMAALQKYGGDFYQQQFNNLAGLAGANISPGVSLSGQQAAAQLAGGAMNRLGYSTAMMGW